MLIGPVMEFPLSNKIISISFGMFKKNVNLPYYCTIHSVIKRQSQKEHKSCKNGQRIS